MERHEPSVKDDKPYSEDVCSICLCSLHSKASGNSVALCILPCSHRFHTECMSQHQLLSTLKRCPLCRAHLPASAQELFDQGVKRYTIIESLIGLENPSWVNLTSEEHAELALIIDLWRQSANKGSMDAMFNIGLMYRLGRGVEKNDEKAFLWYETAADKGHAQAQNNLGFMLNNEKGTSTLRNPEDCQAEAVHWYHMAAEQGLVDAQFNLGVMYRQGRGTRKSIRSASHWFALASTNGSTSAARALKHL